VSGADDVYVDVYHPIFRTRRYDEVVTNWILVATVEGAAPRLAELEFESGATPAIHLGWDPPFGMEFGIETGGELDDFGLLTPRFKSVGERRWFSRYLHPGVEREFIRVARW